MCLAIPGKIVEWKDREPPLLLAVVEFGGVRREISLACVPDAEVGDYILAHAGIAICRIDEAEAVRVLATLEEIEAFEELQEPPAASSLANNSSAEQNG